MTSGPEKMFFSLYGYREAALPDFILSPIIIGPLIIGPAVLSAIAQWFAVRFRLRVMIWLFPVLFHGLAFAEIAREHWDYTGSELAERGGAGAAAAAGLLFFYAWVSINALVTICLFPLWLKKFRLQG